MSFRGRGGREREKERERENQSETSSPTSLEGNGIPINVDTARELFLASANGGDLDGMNEAAKLGIAELYNGDSSDTEVSDATRKAAISFLRRSAVQGHLDAMTNAGLVCLRCKSRLR